jgi:hypothetical protein
LERPESQVHNWRTSTNRAALQVRLGVLRAGISASTILFAALLILPLRALINRVSDGNWGTIDWRWSLEIIGTIAGVWFAVMFVSNFIDSRSSDRRDETANPSFGVTTFMRIIFSANVGLSGLLFWGIGRQHGPAWAQWVSLSFALLAFFGWPRTITLDEVGISQRSLFGTRRTIPYNEVKSLIYDPKQRAIVIAGPETTIKHTSCHSDRAVFDSLLEERTKKEVQRPFGRRQR